MTLTFAEEFQFHTGSIKRIVDADAIAFEPGFQFHTGSIKSRSNLTREPCEVVSIPYWFD